MFDVRAQRNDAMEQAILETVREVHLHPPIYKPEGEDFHHPQMTINTERLVMSVESLGKNVSSALYSVKNEGAENYVRISNSERIDYN